MSEADETTIEDELGTLFGDDDWQMNLHAKPVGPGQYVVLSARNGEPTVHEVDLRNDSCTCEDKKFNRGPHNACAHIAYAALKSDGEEDRDYSLLAHTTWSAQRLKEAADRLEQTATATEADAQAKPTDNGTEATQADTEASSTKPYAEMSDHELEEVTRDWLEDEFGIDRDAGTVEIHPDFGSVNYSPNYEIESGEFKALTNYPYDNDLDGCWFDSDEGTLVIKKEAFNEVFGDE